MKFLPQDVGIIHFIGIGGIGMSGIADVLHHLGYRVQGSDQSDGANVQRLRDKGIECFVGHKAENLGGAEVVVVSTAIRKSNPELVAAREKLLPIVRRAEMLAELMRFRQAVAIGGKRLVEMIWHAELAHGDRDHARDAAVVFYQENAE